MLNFRFRVVETIDTDGTRQWAVKGVGHDSAGQPVKLAGAAEAISFSDDGTSPADGLRAQVAAIMAALDEPTVSASSLTPAEEADWPSTAGV